VCISGMDMEDGKIETGLKMVITMTATAKIRIGLMFTMRIAPSHTSRDHDHNDRNTSGHDYVSSHSHHLMAVVVAI
jgi:hypothetical protein